MGYSSNILYKQPFSSREDIFVSFLIQNPATEIFFSDLLLQIGDKMLLQDESYLQLNFPLTYKGFGVFLVDSNVPLLTGGGSKGLGIITDENTTSLSAVSGFFLCSMYDLEGSFGALSGVNQFKTGTPTHQANSIVVRKLSSFEFVGSQVVGETTSPFKDEWNVFRVAFKNNMQQVIYYRYNNNVYTPLATFNTGISANIPDHVRVGITWSGDFPISLKNININATVDS